MPSCLAEDVLQEGILLSACSLLLGEAVCSALVAGVSDGIVIVCASAGLEMGLSTSDVGINATESVWK